MTQLPGTFCGIVGFVVWLGIVFYMFRIVSLRKPQVKMWRDALWNPFNLILMSSKLTEAGFKARRRLFALVLTFIAMTLIPFLIGTLSR